MSIVQILLSLIAISIVGTAFAEDPPIPPLNAIPGWSVVYGDFPIPENTSEGEVLSIIPSRKLLTLQRSITPYDPMVVGVAVKDSTGILRVATGGEIEVIIDKSSGKISAGEWLVASGSNGKAMALENDYPLNPVVIGIALEDYIPDTDDDRIRVLLTPGEQISLPVKETEE